MNYHFPATIFARTNLLAEQVDHFLSEVDEIEAYGPLLDDSMGDAEAHEAISRGFYLEIIDAMHSAETLLRILARLRGQAYVDSLMLEIHTKNAARGYYGPSAA